MNVRLVRSALAAASGAGRFRRLLVFTFHRVLPEPDPLLPGEPSAEAFARRLDWMRACLEIMPLPEACQRLYAGTLPARAACITFDDGYRNNHDVAAPLLAARGLPASFFIATGAIDKGAMWNDLVIEALRRCGDRLDLEEFGLNSFEVPDETARVAGLESLLTAIKYVPTELRSEIADRLWQRYCGGGKPSLMMSPEMIVALAREGHDVGSHTVSHPILCNLDRAAARREIESSRDWLTRVTGRAPRTFAYPNGRPGVDFDIEHTEMVCAAGFECAVSTAWGCATPGSDRYSLERFAPWEDTFSGFVSRLLKTYVRSYVSAE